MTLHSVQSVGDSESADNLVVDMCPRAVSSVSKTRALVVRDFNPGDSLETLKSSVKGWMPNKNSVPKAHFCLPIEGLDAKMVNDALHTLFDHGAIEGRDGTVSVDVLSQPWLFLIVRECVRIVPRDDPNPAAGSTSEPPRRRASRNAKTSDMQNVQLTDYAVKLMSIATVFESCEPVFSPRRSLPLGDLTAMELGMILQEQGWQLQLLPRKPKDRLGLAHATSNAIGTVYTLGRTLVPAYLQCLL